MKNAINELKNGYSKVSFEVNENDVTIENKGDYFELYYEGYDNESNGYTCNELEFDTLELLVDFIERNLK